jgi:hypothetical protein
MAFCSVTHTPQASGIPTASHVDTSPARSQLEFIAPGAVRVGDGMDVFGLLSGPVILAVATGVSIHLYDIVRIGLYHIVRAVTAACRACFRVPPTPIVAHHIQAARRAAVQANPRRRNGSGEHQLRRGATTDTMLV